MSKKEEGDDRYGTTNGGKAKRSKETGGEYVR